MIHVIAFVTAKPGQRDTLLREFRQLVPTVHAEKGCIEYVPVIDTQSAPSFQAKLGPDTFVVVEKWESVEALAAHAIAPHMKAYHAKAGGMIASQSVHVGSPA